MVRGSLEPTALEVLGKVLVRSTGSPFLLSFEVVCFCFFNLFCNEFYLVHFLVLNQA